MLEPPILHPAVMFRADVIKRYKYKDSPEFYHIEALELWYRMLEGGEKCEIIPHYLLNYRDNQSSVCHSYNDVQVEHHLRFSKGNIESLLYLQIESSSLEIILTKRLKGNLQDLKKAFSLLSDIKDAYIKKYNGQLNRAEKKELETWCDQRKLAIVFTSMMRGQLSLRVRLMVYICTHPYLILSSNGLKYVKNRLIRLYNERA